MNFSSFSPLFTKSFTVIAEFVSVKSNVTMCISLPALVVIARSSASKIRPDTVTLPEFSFIDAIDAISSSRIGLPISISSAVALPIISGPESSTGFADAILYTITFFVSFLYFGSSTSSISAFPVYFTTCSIARFRITSESWFATSILIFRCDFETTRLVTFNLSTVLFPLVPKTVLNSIIHLYLSFIRFQNQDSFF